MLYIVERLEREIKELEFQLCNQAIQGWEHFLRIRSEIEGLRKAVDIVKEAAQAQEFEDET